MFWSQVSQHNRGPCLNRVKHSHVGVRYLHGFLDMATAFSGPLEGSGDAELDLVGAFFQVEIFNSIGVIDPKRFA